MSFPSPEYVRMFLSSKLGIKRGDSTGLLSDGEHSRPSLEEVRVRSNSENTTKGGDDIAYTDNKVTDRKEEIAIEPKSMRPATCRSRLELSGTARSGYGTTYQVGIHTTDEYGRSTNDESDDDSEHCHADSNEKEQTENRKRKKALRKLIIATILSFVFMCGEIIGGYLANSLAIMTDASHLLTDVSSFLVSIIALQMAARPSSKHMTFGWHRAEVVGAITSVLAIWIVTGVLVYLAVMRLIKRDYELDGEAMLITASCAIAFNVIMGIVLHEGGHGHHHNHSHDHHNNNTHDHDIRSHNDRHTSEDRGNQSLGTEGNAEEVSGNVNVRAAFIHVLGDLVQSLGVLIAAFIIYFKPEYKIADPICTFVFSVLVLATTITILRDTVVIIMEGTPAAVNYEVVKERLLSIEGVIAVHDIRIWSLTVNQSVMSCHLAIDKEYKSGAILKQATKKLKGYHNFHSMTIQVESYSMDMDECVKCKPSSIK